jgi:penicillin amidase
MEWRGLKPFASNPQVVNPQQGYIANWNNKPAVDHDNTCTFLWSAADRVSEIEIRVAPKQPIEALWDLIARTSLIDLQARHFVPRILSATATLPPHDRRRRAAEAMRGWDGSLDSRGGTYVHPGVPILRAVLPALLRLVFAGTVPDREIALAATLVAPDPAVPIARSPNIPDLVKLLDRVLRGTATEHDFLAGRDPEAVVRDALDEALAAGQDPTTWTLPAGTTLFRTQNFMGIPQARHADTLALPEFMNRGTENNMAILGPEGIELYDVMPPGQSGFVAPDGTASPHRDDQRALYGAYGRKRHWIAREEAVAHTTKAHTL